MNRSTVIESFSFGEIVRLSGVNARTLDHWAATNFLTPSIKKAAGAGTRRLYSFSDLVAARVARELRSAGASLQGLRKVVKMLRKQEFTLHPFAANCLIVSGKDVYLKTRDEGISTLNAPGQALFAFTFVDLEPMLVNLRTEADKIKPAYERPEKKSAEAIQSARRTANMAEQATLAARRLREEGTA